MQKRQKFINSDCVPKKIPSIIKIILLRIQTSQGASHLLPQRRFLRIWNHPKNIWLSTSRPSKAEKNQQHQKGPPKKNDADGIFFWTKELSHHLGAAPPHGARSTAGGRSTLAAFAACGTTNGSAGSGEVREDWNGCSLRSEWGLPPSFVCRLLARLKRLYIRIF